METSHVWCAHTHMYTITLASNTHMDEFFRTQCNKHKKKMKNIFKIMQDLVKRRTGVAAQRGLTPSAS